MAHDPQAPAEATDHAAVRLDKLRQIEALGIDPWGQRFDGHQPIEGIRALEAGPFSDTTPPGPTVTAAGRVLRHRTGGKLHFLELWDQTGRIQLMVRVNKVSETEWKVLNLLDLGDLIGVTGEYGRTKTGELTIQVTKLTFLTKSLEPHPKDVFGLGDTEYRLRHRYLDMIYTPETMQRVHQRVKIVRAIRTHLDSLGYLEVETPVLQAVASGAAARPFETHHNALDIPLVLRIALELPLKRLLVGGLEKVYELGRVFRNEGVSHKHNPEFTMLELYCAYGDLFAMMDLTERLLVACVDALGNGRDIPWGEHRLNLEPPFARARYGDLFREHVGCDMADFEAVKAKAAEFNVFTTLKNESTGALVEKDRDVLVNDLFGAVVEPTLTGPVFVYDYPAELCPLTKRKRDEPGIAERFELYAHGMELANAYTELNDPITQEATFRKQLAGMSDEDSMATMDDDFIRALRHGMPPAGGLGVGIDRLVMLLTNTPSIRDALLFPLLRPTESAVVKGGGVRRRPAGAVPPLPERRPVRLLRRAARGAGRARGGQLAGAVLQRAHQGEVPRVPPAGVTAPAAGRGGVGSTVPGNGFRFPAVVGHPRKNSICNDRQLFATICNERQAFFRVVSAARKAPGNASRNQNPAPSWEVRCAGGRAAVAVNGGCGRPGREVEYLLPRE